MRKTIKKRLTNRWTLLTLATVSALAAVGTGQAVLAQTSSSETARPVATVNGQAVPDPLFALYLGYARADARAEHPGGDIERIAERSALDSAVRYMVQLQEAQKLGVVSPTAIPYRGQNMTKLRINTSGYGTRTLSDKAVIDGFLANVTTAIEAKLLPPSTVDKTLLTQYRAHPADHRKVLSMTVRRIRLPYTTANRTQQHTLAATLQHQAAAGADFADLAARQDHAYYSDSIFQHADKTFVLTGQEKFADPTLLQVAESLTSGQVSAVVDAGNAYYIVKMQSERTQPRTFAQAEPQLYAAYLPHAYTALLDSWVRKAKTTVDQNAYHRFRN